ncbi:MAG: NAD(P)-binding protein [Acetobacteraceae bacterium]|nr:NAD(P)-binding protein [Acetobacteraceae bacterium]
MTKRRIIILGGGIGGLTTAYYLSRTPELRDRFDVTVHQMGWKLGGKISSGRDELGRNLEHGLHIWFGCYDNAFRMLQEIYARHEPPPGSPFRTWRDVVSAQDFTPIGVRIGEKWGFASIEWPRNDATPGEARLFPTLSEMFTQIINAALILIERSWLGNPPTTLPQQNDLLARLLQLVETGKEPADKATAKDLLGSLKEGSLSGNALARLLHGSMKTLGAGAVNPDRQILHDLAEMTRHLRDGILTSEAGKLTDEATATIFREAFHIGLTLIAGALLDVILEDKPLEALDDIEFRAWLLKHHADPTIVAQSSVVRALYDTAFFYEDGDPAKPTVGAGCAIGVILRLVATYKGSMAWELQGGMGDVFIAPLYQRLLEQGVHFEFFSKVTEITPAADRNAIASVNVIKQAEMLPGYALLKRFDGIDCWLAEPDWAHLKDGERLKAAGVDFESHWCAEPPVATRTLHRGADFDDVVLAMPVGTWKKLNDEAGPCDALLARGGPFADFTTALGIVPTIAVQLWTSVDAKTMGWVGTRPAVVAGPEPICVWADMSQVLRTETPMVPPALGLHYLCGTYPTQLYARPSRETDTPAIAEAEVKAMALKFLQRDAGSYWPLSVAAQDFHWSFLADPSGGEGKARLAAQYIRANIDPSECCVRSDVGTTKFRLHPDETGFDGLWLAGESTRNGFNATCVEATVMSGMAAANRIGGLGLDIVGYDFPRWKPSFFARRTP